MQATIHAVAVGLCARVLGQEQLARHRAHRGQYALVLDPPPAELSLHHP
jgi:hypothetical protein